MRIRNGNIKSAHGYSLVEVTVVVVILIVLAGMTLSAFSMGIMMANRTKCASNMREIGLAIFRYSMEHHGELPVTSHSTGDSRIRVDGEWIRTIEYSWIYRLSGYLDDIHEVRVCPADEEDRQKRILEINATSYLLNDVIFDAAEYGHMDRIRFPSRTAMMFISNRVVSRTWDHAHCAQWTSWAALTTDIAPDRHRLGGRSADRLKGSSNYLFADGHVENMEAATVKQRMEQGQHFWLP